MMRLSLLLCVAAAVRGEDGFGSGNETRRVLDSLARMADSTLAGIDDAFWTDMLACMDTAPDLVASHDAGWAGFLTYWDENGTGTDGWFVFLPHAVRRQPRGGFMFHAKLVLAPRQP